MNNSSSKQEEVNSEHIGDGLTIEEEGSESSSVDEEHINSDYEADKFIQALTNSKHEEEVDQTFHEITERIHLSPRGNQTRGDRTSRGKGEGYIVHSIVTRLESKCSNSTQ